MAVKADPRNVGKRVRFTVKRGNRSYQAEGSIVRFRGGNRDSKTVHVHAAYVRWDTTDGKPNARAWIGSVQLSALEYVK